MVSYALRRLIHPLDDGGMDLGLDEFSAEAEAKRHGGTKIGDDGRKANGWGPNNHPGTMLPERYDALRQWCWYAESTQPVLHDAAGTIRCPGALAWHKIACDAGKAKHWGVLKLSQMPTVMASAHADHMMLHVTETHALMKHSSLQESPQVHFLKAKIA